MNYTIALQPAEYEVVPVFDSDVDGIIDNIKILSANNWNIEKRESMNGIEVTATLETEEDNIYAIIDDLANLGLYENVHYTFGDPDGRG